MPWLFLQFVGWPPSKQFAGDIVPYPPGPHRWARLAALPMYTTSPPTISAYTPGVGGNPRIEKRQKGPLPWRLRRFSPAFA